MKESGGVCVDVVPDAAKLEDVDVVRVSEL